ncbi:MAG: CBS domain-containing protein [Gammaproteobacteria bacterium]|nr:CBS domain-containing protein [Gammaproteobacteria bacterium]
MSIGTICNRNVVTVRADASIREAAALMRDRHIGDVVIIEQRGSLTVPAGILTDRDLVVELLAKDTTPQTVTVGDVMSPDPVTARVDADLLETVVMMRGRGVRRLPVVDEAGGLVGIVTLDDLFDLVSDLTGDISVLISRERRRERQTRP